ncbi:MAG: hypothetical protein F6K19_01715 [Cyanothece sp. SIO1E1]|nr:hypothetical protein [Cyanothece sp. SIO1E1]
MDTVTVEIESSYTVLNEAGATDVVGNSTLSDGSVVVRLFDTGDELRFTFSVAEAGTYGLQVLIRSGNSGSTTNKFDHYDYTLNGNTITGSNGDVIKTLADLGTSHWGYKVFSVPLLQGSNTLDIAAANGFSAVDKIKYYK